MTVLINVLTDGINPNSRAFNYPLLLTKKLFKTRGYKIKFHDHRSRNVLNSDILFVNSKVFTRYWKNKQQIFNFLNESNKRNQFIIWFDTSDSTWSTQFDVLPYVDLFLKNQIFKDKKQYLESFRTGRAFTDFFEHKYGTNEMEVNYKTPDIDQLSKIDVSWNTCFENYNRYRYSKIKRIKNRISPLMYNFITPRIEVDFINCYNERKRDISCRFGTNYSRSSITAHRIAIKELMEARGVSTEIINLKSYFGELINSKIGIGPFGLGEITLRDFEIIICGAVLVKPDMNHMKTWPNIFKKNITYMSHKWDLSDLNDKINMLLDNTEFRFIMSQNAQDEYIKVFSEEGQKKFVNRIINYINN
jgi:hypothetical protein